MYFDVYLINTLKNFYRFNEIRRSCKGQMLHKEATVKTKQGTKE